MLDPDSRSLLTEALRPPGGYSFDQGIATTFSLDLTTLLALPLNLAVISAADGEDALNDAVGLLEALRRVSSRIAVYCQQGRIQAPSVQHVLYALLEPLVIETTAPRGGVFHPKLWVLRFVDQEYGLPLLRVLVLTRNLTQDRSWDLSLVLEGTPRGRSRRENRGLADLIARLPQLAAQPPSSFHVDQARTLADEVRRTDWELPPGFESVTFQVLGLDRRAAVFPESNRLAVISPFCSGGGIEWLAGTTQCAEAFISRPEELARLEPDACRRFAQTKVLYDAAEVEDGEDLSAQGPRLTGLHAKAYVADVGWQTHVIVGSANATYAALVERANVELLAELVGPRRAVGSVASLLGSEGLGPVLTDWDPDAGPVPPDGKALAAEQLLDRARQELSSAGLGLRCDGAKDEWTLTLSVASPTPMAGVNRVRVWPVTLGDGHASDAAALRAGEPVSMGPFALASITGLIAFELRTAGGPPLRFVLNLPVEGLPADERHAAIVRAVVSNREGFLRYLLLLLGEGGDEGMLQGILGPMGNPRWKAAVVSVHDMPILEGMTRVLSRDPDRLRHVGALVRDLLAFPEGRSIVPEEFVAVWAVFEDALGATTNE